MLKCNGTKFYPTSINRVLDGFSSVQLYQVVVKKDNLSDNVHILLALENKNEINDIKTSLHAALRVKVNIEIQDFTTLSKAVFPAGTRKPVKYIYST
jgi:phenylacetate-coenzyme A ligase PaaK-like adenylate-forming protein